VSGIAPRTGIAAVRAGRVEIHHPSRDWTRDCQYFVRTRFGVGPGYATAHAAWMNTPTKHRERPDKAPYGTAGYFHGPPGSAGHAVLMLNGGRCLSNDIDRVGRISVTTVEEILRKWPGYEWDGWTEHVNGVRIWGHGPSLSADAIRKSQRGDHQQRHGALLKRELAAAVGRHGMNLHTDQVGAPMQEAVSALQRQLGFRRTGLVGPSVLAYLADRRSAFTSRP
jgi:hypothetical protein